MPLFRSMLGAGNDINSDLLNDENSQGNFWGSLDYSQDNLGNLQQHLAGAGGKFQGLTADQLHGLGQTGSEWWKQQDIGGYYNGLGSEYKQGFGTPPAPGAPPLQMNGGTGGPGPLPPSRPPLRQQMPPQARPRQPLRPMAPQSNPGSTQSSMKRSSGYLNSYKSVK